MATRVMNLLNGALPELRYEPTEKWIRASLHGNPVLDSRRAVVLWEPMRITPVYAVPEADVLAVLRAARPSSPGPPLTPTAAKGAVPGTVLDVAVGDELLEAAAFRFADPDLEGLVKFDFRAFDWLEEDEPIAAHARDPFHRIDIRSSSRHVRVELEGRLLADSTHPMVLFETRLPARFYLPPGDVAWQELESTESRSVCPYKGTASYWKVRGAERDVAWSYASPVADAGPLAGLVCFYNERVDLTVDGTLLGRPETPFG